MNGPYDCLMKTALTRYPLSAEKSQQYGEIRCYSCQKLLPGPRPKDGGVVCATHDVVGCRPCIMQQHGQAPCRREKGLGPRLFRQLEFGFLLDYMQFAALMRGKLAGWIQDGAKSSGQPRDRERAALSIMALRMAALEDLSFLLHALRCFRVDKPPRETLVQTLLDSKESQLPRLLDAAQTDADVTALVGLEFIALQPLPGIDAAALRDAIARAVFMEAFGTQTQPPNWRITRWRTYQKLKHGGTALSDPARVFNLAGFPSGPGVLDQMDEGKTPIPQPITFGPMPSNLDQTVLHIRWIGFTQQVLVLCHLLAVHRDQFLAVAPKASIDAIPQVADCLAFFRNEVPAAAG